MSSSSSKPPPSSSNRSKETAESLLQAFQSYNKRSTSATPRPPSMPPYPVTPGSQTGSTGNNQTHQQQTTEDAVTTPKKAEASPAVKQSTPTPKTGKRQPHTPFFEGNSSDENEETHGNGSGAKRPRRVVTKKPDHSPVSKEPDSPLFVPQSVQQKPVQKTATTATVATKRLPPTQSVPKLNPQVTVPPKQPTPPTNSASAVQTSDRQGIVQRLSSENKRVANDLVQKNSILLGSFPAGAKLYFEAELDKITKETVALHQQRVDAVKSEYIAKLQKDMSECQKMISILQQNSEQGS